MKTICKKPGTVSFSSIRNTHTDYDNVKAKTTISDKLSSGTGLQKQT